MLGERGMLHLAASLADHAPVSLGEAITGIDDHNVDLLPTAIGHAAGRLGFPRYQDQSSGRAIRDSRLSEVTSTGPLVGVDVRGHDAARHGGPGFRLGLGSGPGADAARTDKESGTNWGGYALSPGPWPLPCPPRCVRLTSMTSAAGTPARASGTVLAPPN